MLTVETSWQAVDIEGLTGKDQSDCNLPFDFKNMQ